MRGIPAEPGLRIVSKPLEADRFLEIARELAERAPARAHPQ
jgi:hypothetical protein